MVHTGTAGNPAASQDVPERIICAAHELHGYVVICLRHCDENAIRDAPSKTYLMDANQGFITNKRRYVNRQEAWQIAEREQQIVRHVGGDSSNGGTLYSENLY